MYTNTHLHSYDISTNTYGTFSLITKLLGRETKEEAFIHKLALQNK